MNLTSPNEIKRLLREHGLRPKKRLGQNFLIDRNVLAKILDAARLGPESLVLEIGPGFGTVTKEAAELARKVVAVEMDRQLIPVLSDVLAGKDNVEVVVEDFLKLDLPRFLCERFEGHKCSVLANLPYYITSPIIGALIGAKQSIDLIVLMVQLEVAERLTAKPGTPDYGSLTVFVSYHCEISVVSKVSHNVFYPPPDVDSAIVRLSVRESPATEVPDEALFFRIVKASFGQRRKTLRRALSGSPELGWSRDTAQSVLADAGIDPVRRGETLSVEEFGDIARVASRQ